MKQTLRDRKCQTSITTQTLAQQARFSIGEVFAVEAGSYVLQEKAQHIVSVFNQLTGMQIRREHIL